MVFATIIVKSFHNIEVNCMAENSKLHKCTNCTDLGEVIVTTNFNKNGKIEDLMLFKKWHLTKKSAF